jgi:hypothetical protein
VIGHRLRKNKVLNILVVQCDGEAYHSMIAAVPLRAGLGPVRCNRSITASLRNKALMTLFVFLCSDELFSECIVFEFLISLYISQSMEFGLLL